MRKFFLSLGLAASFLSVRADEPADTVAVCQTPDTVLTPRTFVLQTPQTADTAIFAENRPGAGQKRPWRAAAEATGINVLVHSFDRFVLKEDFAKSTFKTIWHNATHGFVWDNDQFSTNLFAHPYHGNLYFNSARSNGLSFFESAPYALGGSLMWEVAGEVEPPALNDLIATTVGGIAIGEITHRLSALVYDDRKRGFGRFLREFVGTLINPMGGLNRMIDGDAWRVRDEYYKYHDYSCFPVRFYLTVGSRYLADNGSLFRGEHNPFIDLDVSYGDPFNEEERKPYDYFTANLTFGFTGNQPLVSNVHLLGRLWSTPVNTRSAMQTLFGFFQHFNYYDSEAVKNGTSAIPYRISEAASFGPGIIYRFPSQGAIKRLEQHAFVSGILLGGSLTDYYNVIDRDYNLGSGYSFKFKTCLEFKNYARFDLSADFLHVFTWKGYEHRNLATTNLLRLNAQGDRSSARLFVVRPNLYVRLNKELDLNLSLAGYFRRTHYHYHDDVSSQTFVTRLGITYRL